MRTDTSGFASYGYLYHRIGDRRCWSRFFYSKFDARNSNEVLKSAKKYLQQVVDFKARLKLGTQIEAQLVNELSLFRRKFATRMVGSDYAAIGLFGVSSVALAVY